MFARRTSRDFRGSVILAVLHRFPLLAVIGCATQQAAPIMPSEIVLGSQGAYSLLLMTSGWARVAAAESGEFASDLVLSNAKTGVTVIVYVHSQTERSIDGVVFGRRELLGASNEIVSFEEERSFLPRSEFVPLSVARYRLRGKRDSGWFALMVGTARGPDSIVEVLAIGGPSAQLGRLFEDVIAGLRIPAGSGATP